MQTDLHAEARRQVEICNACRYCEGFCSVFPAIARENAFADGDITQLANLCHNCRGCYYSCQYTEPHEFAVNLPAALAEVRQDSWERLVAPQALTRVLHERAGPISAGLVAVFSLLFYVSFQQGPGGGEGFYAYIAHGVMVAIFAPAFLVPLVALAFGLRSYWAEVSAAPLRLSHVTGALRSAARLRNLDGGQGQGCNFEREDRYSNARRYAHQAVMYGFLLCFASTVSGTVLHYVFGLEAPYGFWSLPKLFGVPGGLLLIAGTAEMMRLKRKAEPELGAPRVRGGEFSFIALLGFVGLSGLLLYAVRGTAAVPPLLALHLGSVLAFFLMLVSTKMVHGFFRLAALSVDEQKRTA